MPKLCEFGEQTTGEYDVCSLHRVMKCESEDLEEIVGCLGVFRESGECSLVRVSNDAGSSHVYARTNVLLCVAEQASWLKGLEIAGDVCDLNILSLAQGIYAAMEKELYTGVWWSIGVPNHPPGSRWWKEVVKGSPLALLSDQTADLGSKIMILAKMVTQIIIGENSIFFHFDSLAATSIQQKGKKFQESLQAGKEVKLDDLEMTATCRKAFNTMIYEMPKKHWNELFLVRWYIRKLLADGAGIRNNTMSDAGPKHEICFSTRHAKEVLEKIQSKGALGIVQVGNEQLVVIAKPNRPGTVKFSNKFGSVKELEEGLRGTNFGGNVQSKFNGLSEETREIAIS